MAKLKVLGSSSSGNSYLLECSNETLILELGLSWKDILKGLNYDLSNICGCLVSHKHQDHSKSIPNAISYGLSVYSCQDVQGVYKDVKVLKLGKKTQIGKGFAVQPINLFHNCECYGFLVQHSEFGRLVFCSDTNSVPYKFKSVQHWMIEANYDNDILIDNACNDMWSNSASENHLEINDTIDVLKHNYSSELQSIILLHLSNGNSNAQDFKDRVEKELGFDRVVVANKGVEMELSISEF